MAKLTPDATRTEHGLVINEKIIPWGAVWPKDSGAYKKGAQYKADRLLSGGTGKVKGVTIHNTNDLKNVEEDAEQYTRATWPNGNMNDARVHYYVDDINAWQNLREDEVGWHAGDGRKATGGNETTLSIEIIMDGSGSKEDRKAEENGVLLAALLLKKHGLSVNELYTHNHWMGHPDSIVQGARKNCPLYILPHWAQFKQKVAAKLTELNGGATTTETGKTEIMGKAKASAQQMALFARSKNAEPQLPACSLEQLAQFFLEEGEAEGVRATSPLRRASTRRAFQVRRHRAPHAEQLRRHRGAERQRQRTSGDLPRPAHGRPGADPAPEGIRLQGGARERVRRPALLPRDTGLGAVCGMAGRKRQPQRQGLGRTGQGLRRQDRRPVRSDHGVRGAPAVRTERAGGAGAGVPGVSVRGA